MAKEMDMEREGARKKIIYVDDVNFNLHLLKQNLKDTYEIYPAQSAKKLFEVLTYVKPDLILLDINMPDEDGYETILALKNDKRYADIPVIFLTSQKGKDSMFKGLNLGAAAYICKPYTASDLIAQIEKVLQHCDVTNPMKDLLEVYTGRSMGDDIEEGEEGEERSESVEKPSILAIDDVSAMLRMLYFALCDQYKVFTLVKPEELRNMLQTVAPDLFLLDYNMPKVSGFDLVPVIRSFPKHKNTPIIFITGDGTPQNIITASKLGACDFIVKPIDVEELRKKVAKHLGLNKDVKKSNESTQESAQESAQESDVSEDM